nr:reverse transcriptase domain-containing protein [Tanacetum cinerariifolium]
SSSKLTRDQTSNPTSSENSTSKGQIRRSSKQKFQSNPPPAQVKAVEEICVTCGCAHPYYQCLAAGGNTFPEYRDNIQGYVSAATGNFNQGNPGYRPQGVANQMRPPGSRTLPGNIIANSKGELKVITTRSGLVTDGPIVPNHLKSVNPEEDECVEETYTDPDHAEYTIKVPPPPPVQKPKPPIQRNFVIHTRDSLPPHIPELKCKALADLGASINLMPLSLWKKLGLPDLIPTQMTLELANRAICTRDRIARDVFVPVGKFTFLADFVVVDYESDPRVPLILGRPFLRTARALIDVYCEEMILRDGDERLTLNMKHNTASYSNHPYRESVNLINIFNLSRMYFLSEELPDIDSFNDIYPHFDDDPLSGSTTYSANSLLEEFADELALISYPLDYDDNRVCDIESDIREIEFLRYQGEDSNFKDSIDQSVLTNHDELFVDPTLEMFTDEQPINYSFPSRFDVYPDDFLKIKPDTNFDDDFFDSEGEKIKEAELLIDQLDLPCDILFEYDSFNSQDFSRDDVLPSLDNEDKFLLLLGCLRILILLSMNFLFSKKPFLRTARALIDVHGEEMIPHDGDESEDCLKDLVSNKQSGNPTFLLHKEIASPEVIPEFYDSKGCKDSNFKDSIDQSVLTHLNDLFVDPTPEMFTEEQPLDYSFPPRFDVYPDNFLEIEDDVLFSPDNEDKVFNPGILSHEKSVKIITRVTQKKKLGVSFASWLFEDFDPPFYELLVFK